MPPLSEVLLKQGPSMVWLDHAGAQQAVPMRELARDVQRRLDENQQDAQRYRWLKRYCGFGIRKNGVHELTVSFSMVQPDSIHQLDAAIDAAMKEQE